MNKLPRNLTRISRGSLVSSVSVVAVIGALVTGVVATGSSSDHGEDVNSDRWPVSLPSSTSSPQAGSVATSSVCGSVCHCDKVSVNCTFPNSLSRFPVLPVAADMMNVTSM